eukprot:scaffold82886_cov25-Tisochrysis_lutea.AAC.2
MTGAVWLVHRALALAGVQCTGTVRCAVAGALCTVHLQVYCARWLVHRALPLAKALCQVTGALCRCAVPGDGGVCRMIIIRCFYLILRALQLRALAKALTKGDDVNGVFKALRHVELLKCCVASYRCLTCSDSMPTKESNNAR